MIHLCKAVFGKCPWCSDNSEETRYDRIYNWVFGHLPDWVWRGYMFVTIDANPFWHIGWWWHKRYHGKEN